MSNFTVDMDLTGMKNGDYSGLCAFMGFYGTVGVKKENDEYFVTVCKKGEDKKQYEEIYFRINGKEYFRVDETFPRLVTENVSPEILRVKYDLSIAGIQPWKTKEDALWN